VLKIRHYAKRQTVSANAKNQKTMSQFLLISTAVFGLTVAHGQTAVYHPFPDSGAVWREMCSGSGASIPPVFQCDDFENYYKGDTIVGAFTYRQLWQNGVHWANNCSVLTNSWNNYIGALVSSPDSCTDQKYNFLVKHFPIVALEFYS
jgi:hypothetical protein